MAVEAIELDELKEGTGNKLGLLNNLELIKNVKVKLEVYVGETEISVGDLSNLKQNSVVKLNRDVAAPVDIVLDGKVIARGVLSAVDNNFGVRITEIEK